MIVKKILITGSRGFVGKNLINLLSKKENIIILEHSKDDSDVDLLAKLKETDFLVHLAGVNRPKNESAFNEINFGLTKKIISMLKGERLYIPIIFSSSTQVLDNNPYGRSKLDAEEALLSWQLNQGNKLYILRLPGIFGQGCKPNYNSVVATFCNNIQKDIPIEIHDPKKVLQLIYIQDVIDHIANIIEQLPEKNNPIALGPVHEISLYSLAQLLKEFKKGNLSDTSPDLGIPLKRALLKTYQSYVV